MLCRCPCNQLEASSVENMREGRSFGEVTWPQQLSLKHISLVNWGIPSDSISTAAGKTRPRHGVTAMKSPAAAGLRRGVA